MIRNIAAITAKELRIYLVSPIAYVFSALMIGIVSYFGLSEAISSGSPTLRGIFDLTAQIFLPIMLPLLTMRLLAEERRQGSLELLLTSPVRDSEVVLGKFLGSFILFFLMTLFMWIDAGALNIFTNSTSYIQIGFWKTPFHPVDFGPMISGYIGVLLMGALLLALGILLSSLTSNQVIAAVAGIVASFFFFYLEVLQGLFPASTTGTPGIGDFAGYAAGYSRYAVFAGGEIAWRDVLYFVSLTVVFIFFTVRVLESRRYA
jgi:ABC-2 type transport system permease protein